MSQSSTAPSGIQSAVLACPPPHITEEGAPYQPACHNPVCLRHAVKSRGDVIAIGVRFHLWDREIAPSRAAGTQVDKEVTFREVGWYLCRLPKAWKPTGIK